MSNNRDELLTLSEFSKLLKVHKEVARRWIVRGKVNYSRTPGGEYRIPMGEIKRLTALVGGPEVIAKKRGRNGVAVN